MKNIKNQRDIVFLTFILWISAITPVYALDISIEVNNILTSKPVATADTKPAPPDHAPAHGVRKKYQYQYYPATEVYFEPARAVYFYLANSHWQVAATLPNSLRLRLGSFVSSDMESDKPYIEHKNHRAKYPPGQAKKKNHPAKNHHHDNGKPHKNKSK